MEKMNTTETHGGTDARHCLRRFVMRQSRYFALGRFRFSFFAGRLDGLDWRGRAINSRGAWQLLPTVDHIRDDSMHPQPTHSYGLKWLWWHVGLCVCRSA